MDLKKKKILVICLLVFICVAISIWQSKPAVIQEGTLDEQKNIEQQAKETEKKQSVKICVYISGAVKNPGLHYIPLGSRGKDAVILAGGFLANANKDKVNLAKKLKDGNHLNIPFLREAREKRSKEKKSDPRQSSGGTYNAAQTRELMLNRKININTGTQKELEKLPGIGPALAERIIKYRGKTPFSQIEDMQKVIGIGEKKFKQLRAYLEV